MARIFTYRGKTIEELQKLSLQDFAQLLTSRQRRKILQRGLTIEEKKFVKNVEKAPDGKFIKTHLRDMLVLPVMVGRKIGIHNGKEFVPVNIIPEMMGHRLGDLSITIKRVKHSGPGIGATRSSKFIPLK